MYRKLFLDDLIIERKENVSRVVSRPEKYKGNPIIKYEGHPWEEQPTIWGTVFYDEEDKIFKMWYNSVNANLPLEDRGVILYATSKDGIEWKKPKLGVVEFQGSKDNNIVLKGYGVGPRIELGAVVKDMEEPIPERRYKMIYTDIVPLPEGAIIEPSGARGRWAFCAAYSPDGIHWTKSPHNPVYMLNDCNTDENYMFYDKKKGKFVILFQYTLHKKGPPGVSIPGISSHPIHRRCIGKLESEDFIYWTHPKIILTPDPVDPWDAHLYSMSPFIYENIYIGFLLVYRDHVKMGVMDCQLTTSRDGENWIRVGCSDQVYGEAGWTLEVDEERKPFIPLGPEGSWDSRNIQKCQPVIVGDEIWIYYGASSKAHNDPSRNVPGTRSIGLAKLKRDRFVSMETAGDKEGLLVTTPILWHSKALHVNSSGQLAVEVLGLDDQPLPGYTKSDCDIFVDDNIDHIVTWNGVSNHENLVKKGVKLKFYLKNAKLYSFWFT